MLSELTAADDDENFEAVDFGAGVVTSVAPTSAVTLHNMQQQTFCGLSVKTGCVVTGTGPHELVNWMLNEIDPCPPSAPLAQI